MSIKSLQSKNAANQKALQMKREFEKLSTGTNWRLYFENKIIPLQYFEGPHTQGIATISFLISENGGNCRLVLCHKRWQIMSIHDRSNITGKLDFRRSFIYIC